MKILVSAFEHSANVHLEAVTKEFTGDVELVGVFNPRLGKTIIDLRALAVMGFVDALKKLPFFLGLSKQMMALVPEVDKVLLIDSSGFNLPLAKKIKKSIRTKRSSTTSCHKHGRGRKNVFLFWLRRSIILLPFYRLSPHITQTVHL